MIKKAVRISKDYLHGVINDKEWPPTKFFVFAQGRSGSTLLCRLLDGHSKIDCREEIFHQVWRPFPATYACGLSKSSQAPTFGFKVKIYQLTDRLGYPNPQKFLGTMHNRGWKIIYLWRRNILRQAISRQIAKQKNTWHLNKKNENKVLQKVSLTPHRVLEKIKEKQQFLEMERKLLGNLPFLEVTYEDDLLRQESRDKAMKRIFNYLNLAFERTTTDMQRTSVDDLRLIIKNYDELESFISNTEYSHLLA